MSFGVETVATLTLTVFIIGSNVVILLMLFTTDMLALLNKYFFVSLTLADLCVGLFVTPFSVWTTVFDRWIYGDRFCHIEAYCAAVLCIVTVHSLAWLSVDQYVALRKPDRHTSIMTPTRSACWVAFVWSSAIGFCVSPLFGQSTARYYAEAYVCVVDWTSQTAYFVTAGTLILVPPLVALAFANLYIFTSNYERDKSIYDRAAVEQSAAAAAAAVNAGAPVPVFVESTRPELYAVNVIVGWIYVAAWLPWCILQIYCHFATTQNGVDYRSPDTVVEYVQIQPDVGVVEAEYRELGLDAATESVVSPVPSLGPPALHFWLTWLAIGNSFWKFVVYVVCFHDFRTGLKILYNNYIACR